MNVADYSRISYISSIPSSKKIKMYSLLVQELHKQTLVLSCRGLALRIVSRCLNLFIYKMYNIFRLHLFLLVFHSIISYEYNKFMHHKDNKNRVTRRKHYFNETQILNFVCMHVLWKSFSYLFTQYVWIQESINCWIFTILLNEKNGLYCNFHVNW